MDPEPNDHRQDRAAALAAVEQDCPDWVCWPGALPPLVYARRPRTSPPLVVRAADADGLRAEIVAAEIARGLRQAAPDPHQAALADYRRAGDLIEAEAAAGQITREQAAAAMANARAAYEQAITRGPHHKPRRGGA